MSGRSDASKILDDEFLQVRAKLLDLAGRLDRIGRAAGGLAGDDARLRQIHEAIRVLDAEGSVDRARRVQMIFSLPYDQAWRKKFGI